MSSTATHVEGAFADDIPDGLPRPGDLVAGKLLVEKVIGRGGMGIVYAAHHQSLDERVALKFVLPEVARRGDAVKRFMKEARAAAKIRGEHVGSVLDVAELPDGTPYMVMEYLEGKDLGGLLERDGVFTVERAVDFTLQACEALAQAHAVNIVHRDLKPSNLFLCRRANGGPLIKVLDFGISKIDDRTGDARLTASSSVMGSPSYMSPEQLRSSREVDARADIWSLGVVLYELLTGSVPFEAGSLVELGVLVMTTAPPNVRVKRPEVPERLDLAIQRCLAKEPSDRFRDVSELAAAIQAFGSRDAPISARSIALTLGHQPTSMRPGELAQTVLLVEAGASSPVLAQPMASGRDATVPSTDGRSPRLRAIIVVGMAGLLGIVVVGLILATRPQPNPAPLVATGEWTAPSSLTPSLSPFPSASASTSAPATSATTTTEASSALPPVTRPTPRLPADPTRPRTPTPPASSAPPVRPSPSGITLDRHG